MKKLFYLTILEKIMLSLLVVLISLLAFSSYEEQHKHGNFINNIQNCSDKPYINQHIRPISQD